MGRRLILGPPAAALWAYASWQVAGATYASESAWPTHAAATICFMVALVLPVAIVAGVVLNGGVRIRPLAPVRPMPPATPVPVVHATITALPAVTR